MAGFFARAGQRLADVGNRVADAVSGTNETDAFLQGQKMGFELDKTKAETDAAMQLAKERRVNAELKEAQRVARDRVARAGNAALTDPNNVPLADLMAAELGGDYSSVMSGRNAAQQYSQRQTVGTPAVDEADAMGFGAAAGPTAAERGAAMDALSPAAAIATRRPSAPGTPVIVDDGDGGSVYVTPDQAPGRKPAARPATAPQPTSQQRNIDDLVTRGVPVDMATRLVYNEVKDPRAAFTQLYGRLRGNFASEQEAQREATAIIEEQYGLGALDDAQDPLIDGGEQIEIPAGSRAIGRTKTGEIVYEAPNGERFTE